MSASCESVIEQIWAYLEENPGAEVSVDLEARTVTAGPVSAPIQVDDYTRWRLLNGLDDISLTLQNEADISAFEAGRPVWKPVTQHA